MSLPPYWPYELKEQSATVIIKDMWLCLPILVRAFPLTFFLFALTALL